WPAPKDWLRSRCSRTIVESSFCAATRPSQVSGASRQVSQLPHPSTLAASPLSLTDGELASDCPKYARRLCRRHSTVSHSASMASRCCPSRVLYERSPGL